MSSSRAVPVPSRTGVRSMITVTYLSPRRVCRQTCSSTPMTRTPSNRPGSSISTPPAFVQDRAVGRVPGDSEACSDPVDGQVVDHDAFQRPAKSAAGDLRPRRGGLRHVLPPDVSAAGAPVTAQPDQQRRRPPPERFVRQGPDDGVSGNTLASAAAAPLVRVHDQAHQQCPVRLQTLADDIQAEVVEPAELGQVRGIEGSVGHVEVFRMGSVGTSIIGRPRPLSGHRRANAIYTLDSDDVQLRRRRQSMAAWSTCAAQPSDSATSPFTSRGHCLKPEASDRNCTLDSDEPGKVEAVNTRTKNIKHTARDYRNRPTSNRLPS